MEIIKFRAWDNILKKMYEVVAIDWVDNQIISAHLKRNGEVRKVYPDKKYGDDIIFMQYTGLNDKNNKEIFNRDIIEFETEIVDKKEKWLSEIKFKYSAWICISPFGAGDMFIEDMQNDNIVEGVVVGNIHDNPELLL